MKQANFLWPICLTLVLFQFGAAAESYGGSGSTASGGTVYLEETFFPIYVNRNDGSLDKSIGTETGLGYDLRTTLGYIAWSNVLFGATFNLYNVDTSRPSTSDWERLESRTRKTEFGPTAGYLIGSWRFILTYIAFAEKQFHEKYFLPNGDPSTDDDNRYTQGSGYQISVAYGLNFGTGFSIGPTLLYREVSYQRQKLISASSTSQTVSPKTKGVDSELKPMITLVYRF